MSLQLRLVGVGVGFAWALFGTAAIAAGDAARGEALAEQWCASCHAVSDEAVQTDTPPAFKAIVGERGRDADWIAAWLVTPHQNMPDLSLTGREIDDLVAYMESLRPVE